MAAHSGRGFRVQGVMMGRAKVRVEVAAAVWEESGGKDWGLGLGGKGLCP